MKKIAYIFSFIFLSFIAGPTVVACIDDSVDVSFAFTANEEENSSKNLLSFEYTIEETHSNHQSIHFLQQHASKGYSYTEDYHKVFLDVICPPPTQEHIIQFPNRGHNSLLPLILLRVGHHFLLLQL